MQLNIFSHVEFMLHHIVVASSYVCVDCFFAVPLVYYGLQHYLSLVGSFVFVPLIIVPAMGGTDVSIFSVSSSDFNSKSRGKDKCAIKPAYHDTLAGLENCKLNP